MTIYYNAKERQASELPGNLLGHVSPKYIITIVLDGSNSGTYNHEKPHDKTGGFSYNVYHCQL